MRIRVAMALAVATGLAGPVYAEGAGLCAYKPSIMVDSAATKIGETGRALADSDVGQGARAGAAAGAKAAGNWMLMHPGQSVSLVSGAAGTASSAAAGASGLAATATAIATAPVTLVVGAVTFAAAGSYEGLCYFKVQRVTDPEEVRAIIDNISLTDPLVWTRNTNKGPVMVLGSPKGETVYPIKDLYIADGVLKVREWGLNGTLGPVAYVEPEHAQ